MDLNGETDRMNCCTALLGPSNEYRVSGDAMFNTLFPSIRKLFDSLFHRDFVLSAARHLGAIRRLRLLHPFDFLWAIVGCALGDEHRSIATARRQFFHSTGLMPEESSFYDRINTGMVSLAWLLFLHTVKNSNRNQRQQLAHTLKLSAHDIRVVDASQVTLPYRAAVQFPSTDSRHGGVKLTLTLSLLESLLTQVRLTDARTHDRMAFELPADVSHVLYLMDRGYSDHGLFAEIHKRGGFFLTRLKESSIPVVRIIRCGLSSSYRGQPLPRNKPLGSLVDVDCSFRIKGRKPKRFRVVGLPGSAVKGQQGARFWLVTNLASTQVDAQMLGVLYRLRWNIETLFRLLKSVGRLDQLQSGRPEVIELFTVATLLGLALAQAVCAILRRERPEVEPSVARVLAILLGQLPGLLNRFGTDTYQEHLKQLIAALWREGFNPNPGRPYAMQRHLNDAGTNRTDLL